MEQFEEIDTQKAKELIDQGNITIVDIRDPDAFEAGMNDCLKKPVSLEQLKEVIAKHCNQD